MYVHLPGEVAHLARGQLYRDINFSLSLFVPENLVSRDRFGPSRSASACSFSTLRLNLMPTHGISPVSATAFIYTVNRHFHKLKLMLIIIIMNSKARNRAEIR